MVEDGQQVAGSKGVQLMAMGLAQLLSFPRELAFNARVAAAENLAAAPENEAAAAALAAAAQVELAVVGGRTILMFVVPAANWWRSTVNFKLQRPYIAVS